MPSPLEGEGGCGAAGRGGALRLATSARSQPSPSSVRSADSFPRPKSGVPDFGSMSKQPGNIRVAGGSGARAIVSRRGFPARGFAAKERGAFEHPAKILVFGASNSAPHGDSDTQLVHSCLTGFLRTGFQRCNIPQGLSPRVDPSGRSRAKDVRHPRRGAARCSRKVPVRSPVLHEQRCDGV